MRDLRYWKVGGVLIRKYIKPFEAWIFDPMESLPAKIRAEEKRDSSGQSRNTLFLRRGDYNVNMVSKCEYSPSQMGISWIESCKSIPASSESYHVKAGMRMYAWWSSTKRTAWANSCKLFEQITWRDRRFLLKRRSAAYRNASSPISLRHGWEIELRLELIVRTHWDIFFLPSPPKIFIKEITWAKPRTERNINLPRSYFTTGYIYPQ